ESAELRRAERDEAPDGSQLGAACRVPGWLGPGDAEGQKPPDRDRSADLIGHEWHRRIAADRRGVSAPRQLQLSTSEDRGDVQERMENQARVSRPALRLRSRNDLATKEWCAAVQLAGLSWPRGGAREGRTRITHFGARRLQYARLEGSLRP